MLIGANAGPVSSVSRSLLLSSSERDFVVQGVAAAIRSDGRELHQFRPFLVELNPVPQAAGSARIKLGRTDILVSIKTDLGPPDLNEPLLGKVQCAVECSAGSAQDLEER